MPVVRSYLLWDASTQVQDLKKPGELISRIDITEHLNTATAKLNLWVLNKTSIKKCIFTSVYKAKIALR